MYLIPAVTCITCIKSLPSPFPPSSQCTLAPASSPLNITTSNQSPTSVAVTWAPPTSGDRNGIVRRYWLVLQETETGNDWTRSTTTTHYLFDFLQEDFDYSLRLAADTVEIGPFSEELIFTTLPDGKS